MKREILLYTTIYSYTAANFIEQLEASKNEDIVIRINTAGGNPEDAFGMVAKLSERKGRTQIKVDGKAHSMGAFLLCYCDSSECLDVSEFLIHRASYGSYYEGNPEIMTTEMWANLDRINAKLRAAFEAKVDVEKFERLKGVTLDAIFSNDARIDVILTADEALAVGLVTKIVDITPQKKAELQQLILRIAAESTGIAIEKPIKKTKMTIEQLKAEHPEVYASAVAAGVNQEKDRVGAFMAFVDVDPDSVKKAIKEGGELTQTLMAEMSLKAISAQRLKGIEADAPGAIETTEPVIGATAAEKSLLDFQNTVKKNLGK